MEHDYSVESRSSSSDEIRDAALASREPFPVRLTGYMVDFCAYIEKESLKLCQEWIRNTAASADIFQLSS